MCKYVNLLSVACCMDFVCFSLQYVVTTLAPSTTPPTTLVQVRSSGSSSLAVDSGPSLEFLGPEMANLQQLLATMTTGERETWKISVVYLPSISLHSSITLAHKFSKGCYAKQDFLLFFFNLLYKL